MLSSLCATVTDNVSKLRYTNGIFLDLGAKVDETYYCDLLLSQQLLPDIRHVSSEYIAYFFGRLRNDLYCVGWGVKLYSLTHSHTFFGPPCIVCVIDLISSAYRTAQATLWVVTFLLGPCLRMFILKRPNVSPVSILIVALFTHYCILLNCVMSVFFH